MVTSTGLYMLDQKPEIRFDFSITLGKQLVDVPSNVFFCFSPLFFPLGLQLHLSEAPMSH